VKLFLAVVLALPLLAQESASQPAPVSEAAAERHRKAVELVQLNGGRDRLEAAIPQMVEQGKAELRKDCRECRPEFVAEWGKRMTARFKADDFVNVAARAYEKRFTNDELTEFLAVTASYIPTSPSLRQRFCRRSWRISCP